MSEVNKRHSSVNLRVRKHSQRCQ